MDNWIEDLKEGDTVIIGGHGAGRFSSIGKVSRITKAQVIVGTTKYRKTDGWQVGGDMWSRTFLRKADPAQIQKVKDRQLKMKIVHKLADQDWNNFSLQSLVVIINTVVAESSKSEGATNAQ